MPIGTFQEIVDVVPRVLYFCRKLTHNFISFRVSLQLIMYLYCIDVWPIVRICVFESGE